MAVAALISRILATFWCFLSAPEAIFLTSPCVFPTAGARTSICVASTNCFASDAMLRARGGPAASSSDIADLPFHQNRW
jgi:hypothetical protein